MLEFLFLYIYIENCMCSSCVAKAKSSMWPLMKKTATRKIWHKRNRTPHVVEYTKYNCSLSQYHFCKGNLIWPTVNAEYAKYILFSSLNYFHICFWSHPKVFRYFFFFFVIRITLLNTTIAMYSVLNNWLHFK